MSLNIGDQIPEFELYNHDKTKYSDKDFLGQKTMFVFMPLVKQLKNLDVFMTVQEYL